MAGPAEGLQAVRVIDVLARFALQRCHVVALQPTSLTAHDAAVPIAFEDGAADGGPAASIQEGMMLAHGLLSCVVLFIRCSISRQYICSAPGHVIIENITARSANSRSKVWFWSE